VATTPTHLSARSATDRYASDSSTADDKVILQGSSIRRVRAAPISLQIASRGARVNNFGASWMSYGFRGGFGIANFHFSSASGRENSSQKCVTGDCSQPWEFVSTRCRVWHSVQTHVTTPRSGRRLAWRIIRCVMGVSELAYHLLCVSHHSPNGNFGKQITLPSDASSETTT
jgi:hypothetical protein